jgi:fatty-acyl-CoA synthase
LDVQVVLTAPHSLPQTSSGKLSRSRARSMYLDGAFARTVATVEA